jgi:hypothetical protein
MLKRLFLLALALCSPLAFAVGTVTGTIVDYEDDIANGKVTITVSVAATGTPACASANTTKFAYDGATAAAGRMVNGDVKTAKELGRGVTITGTGVCTSYSTIENLAKIKVTQ